MHLCLNVCVCFISIDLCGIIGNGWSCDNCDEHFDDEDDGRYRCIEGCDYDLCTPCYEEQEEEIAGRGSDNDDGDDGSVVKPVSKKVPVEVDSSKGAVVVPVIYDLLQNIHVSLLRSV